MMLLNCKLTGKKGSGLWSGLVCLLMLYKILYFYNGNIASSVPDLSSMSTYNSSLMVCQVEP
jgi:hypothetical protein